MVDNNLPSKNPPYHAYMLRFWPEQQPSESVWRFTLLDPHSGQRQGFQSLDALFSHLASLTGDETAVQSFKFTHTKRQA